MTTAQKMKDAEKAVLQDELNFYSRLLATHYNSKKKSEHPVVQSTWTRNYGNSSRSVLKASMDRPQHYKPTSFQYQTTIPHKPNQNSKYTSGVTFHKQANVHNKIAFNQFNFKKYPSKSSTIQTNPSALPHKSLNHVENTLGCNILLKKNHTDFKKQVNCSDMNKPSASSSRVLMSEISVLLEQLKQKTKNINKTDQVPSKVSSLNKCILNKPELKMHTNISSGANISSYAPNCNGQTSDKLNEKDVFTGNDSNLSLLDAKIETCNKLPNIASSVKSETELKRYSLNHLKQENLKIPSKIFDETSRNTRIKVGNPVDFQVHNAVKVPIAKKLIRKRTNSFKKIGGTTFASKYKVVNKNQACVQQKKLIVQVSPEVKTPLRKTPGKKHISSIKKIKCGTRLMNSKYKIINKKLPCVQPSNSEKSLQGVSGNNGCKLFIDTKWANSEIKVKTSKLNSKYKIVNKIGKSLTKTVSPFGKKSIDTKERKLGHLVHQGNKNLNKFSTSSFSNKNVYISSRLHGELRITKNTRLMKQNHTHVLNLKRKKRSHAQNSFFTNSKYKTVNKQLGSSLNKISKTTKPNNHNSSIDLDLLMELAAEKKVSSNPLSSPSKHILIKRLYKSKNAIVNKNVCSLQTRAAKMIKTKYSVLNKKQTWQNFSRRVTTKCIKGHKFNGNYHRKMYPFFSQTNKRHFSKYKNRHISTYFDASIYGRGCRVSKNRSFAVGSAQIVKTPKRFISHKRLFLKPQNTLKTVSPISKAMASRALNRSINRVLTASVKKKTSKVNIYCMFYNRFGRCNKGVKCPYIHDPSKIAICTRFLRGTCKTKNCPFSHEICPGKMAICSFFLLGSCTKIDCPYRHETLPPNAKLCKAFVQGYCPDGKQCMQAHVLFCPQFVQGHCEKGRLCPFPHPPSKGKKNVQNSSEKSENLKETEELTLEKMSRYFECSSESDHFSVNSVAVQRTRNLPEQPSFIAL